MSVGPRELARIDREARAEAEEIRRANPDAVIAIGPGRRCRICNNPEARELVNRCLSHLMSVQATVDSCRALNAQRPKNAQITYDAVRWHATHHFNVQEPARASWRNIMERRKVKHAQSDADMMADGVESLLTIFGYLEVLGQKGFQNLISDETIVSPIEGANALLRLHELTKKGGTEAEMLALRREVGVLQQAVREVVPEEYWAAIRERIEEVYTGRSVLDAEVVADPDAPQAQLAAVDDDDYGFDDAPYAPTHESDPDDPIED
jgi:hypothetical protein